MGIDGIEKFVPDSNPVKIGDIQVDANKTEWVVVGIQHAGLSRVKRNSLAHQIHAQAVPEISKSLDTDKR